MDDGTMTSTDEAMALIRAADADPGSTVLMLLQGARWRSWRP